MSTAYRSDSASPESTAKAQYVTLRWWPAAALLLAGVFLRFMLVLFESPSLPILLLGFLGPAVVGVLVVVWWLAASRAGWKERLGGLVGVLVLAVGAIAALHFTLKGMSVPVLVIPTGMAMFALALILLARVPRVRTVVAVACAGLGFGAWDLLRSEGMTGGFKPELAWRWQPTAEQRYLASRNSSNAKRPDPTLAGSPAQADATNTDKASLSKTVLSVDASSAQWPAFRGLARDAKLAGVTLDDNWKLNPPKEIWKVKIGPGWSSFAVANDALFTQEQRGDNEAVVCLDAKTGGVVWEHEYPGRFWEDIGGAGPRATPTLANSGLFTLGATGILLALDPNDGTVKWQRDLKVDAQREPPMWGFAASPLVDSGLVIVHAGGAKQLGVLAYDEQSGELKWSVPSGDHSYCSAQLATFFGTKGLLMLSNSGLQFLQVADGKTIWEHDWSTQNFRAIQPLVSGESVTMATSSGLGSRKVSVSKVDDKWLVKEEWTTLQMKPEYNDFVEHKGYLYGFDGSVFACLDMENGKRKWKGGRYGNGQVLLLQDSGQLLITSEKGQLVLLNASPDALDEVAKFQAIEGKTWNHPVLIGNRVYVRNGQEAACFELKLK